MTAPTLRDALKAMTCTNPNEVKAIENFIQTKKRTNIVEYMFELRAIVEDRESGDFAFRALIFMGMSLSKMPDVGDLRRQWVNVPPEARASFRNTLALLLRHPDAKFRTNAANCIRGLLSIEYPVMWPEFCKDVVTRAGDTSLGEVSVCGFLTLLDVLFYGSFFDKAMERDIVVGELWSVLFAYIREHGTPLAVRTHAIKAFRTGLHLFDKCIERDGLGDLIVVLCNNLSVSDVNVRRYVYEALEYVCIRHFKVLNEGMMRTVHTRTYKDFLEGECTNKVLAIDFWMKIAGASADNRCDTYIAGVAPSLVPILMGNLRLEVRDEDEDENVKNVKQSSVLCLNSFVKAAYATVSQPVLKFISENISSKDPPCRIASLLAIYAVIGSAEFYPVLSSQFPVILGLASDSTNQEVQDTGLFMIAHSLTVYPQLMISPRHFVSLIEIIVKNVSGPPVIGIRCFDLLHAMIGTFKSSEQEDFLGCNYEKLWSLFTSALGNRDPPFMTAVFEALNEFISHLPCKCQDNIIMILKAAVNGIDVETRGGATRADTFQYVAFLCSVISTVAARIREGIAPFVDDIMKRMLMIMSEKNSMVYEEALITTCHLAEILGDRFACYHEPLLPLVMQCFESHVPSLIGQCAELIKALFDSPSPLLLMATERVYDCVIQMFDPAQSRTMNRDLKPFLLNALVSVSSTSRRDLNKKFFDIVTVLSDLQKEPIEVSDKDDVEFGTELFAAVFYGYVVALEHETEERYIKPNFKQIMRSVERVMELSLISEAVMDGFLKLVYRLIQVGGRDICVGLGGNRHVTGLFDLIETSGDPRFIEKTRRVRSEIEMRMTRGF